MTFPSRTGQNDIDPPLMGASSQKVPMLNAWVHDVPMDDIVEHLRESVLLTLHVDMIMKLQTDREFHALLDQFDVITCDSQIMYFVTKFLGTPVRERVSAKVGRRMIAGIDALALDLDQYCVFT